MKDLFYPPTLWGYYRIEVLATVAEGIGIQLFGILFVAEGIITVGFQHVAPSVRALDNISVGFEQIILVGAVLFARNQVIIRSIKRKYVSSRRIESGG